MKLVSRPFSPTCFPAIITVSTAKLSSLLKHLVDRVVQRHVIDGAEIKNDEIGKKSGFDLPDVALVLGKAGAARRRHA